MEKIILHKADTRGHANYGWLDTRYSFSFAGYHDPEKVHFGVLRVLNDDAISPGMGFGTHPHENMEIITIPLEGAVAHLDSMGHSEVIRAGEIQVMSAGSGITHSEFNASRDNYLRLLQIWVFPRQRDVTPRYAQATFHPQDRMNRLQQVLGPGPAKEGLWIHQDAWFYLGKLQEGFRTGYTLKKAGNGIYAFLISGSAEINGTPLQPRDGVGISGAGSLNIAATSDVELLLMELPMLL